MRQLAAACVLLLAASTLGCSNRRDERYVMEMRPVVVQYAEAINQFGSYLPEDFAKFSGAMVALRRQAILVYPPRSGKMKALNLEFIVLLAKAEKMGFVFSTEYLDYEDQTGRESDPGRKQQVAVKWERDAREACQEFMASHDRIRSTLAKTFEYPVTTMDVNSQIDDFIKRLTQ